MRRRNFVLCAFDNNQKNTEKTRLIAYHAPRARRPDRRSVESSPARARVGDGVRVRRLKIPPGTSTAKAMRLAGGENVVSYRICRLRIRIRQRSPRTKSP